ncbi:probable ubiquitin carboxyl-terminal hydrolase MINDY-4 isoform X1 [Coregonus clupeaformis]|uniref:probable ubiquitin carboxyl-terminal hydrolase MINDY-4 isoform X1 n=2 Tax=Coregonus clupeaformis TaxID=59861 RepID=UPI001BE04ED8|nr:probable ubiquitin carboxyl-terminal hydrolase MINDY-4 isoform X1 [Coregonus clupeaformis]XP_041745693.1 probable ubiquitin carboxyl-terminal hydrolase MINDY-4 isoform X1 [Coregonus clupeaformis]
MLQIMVVRVEEVAASLVREFLSRKGLKRTIACMDEEHPRTDASINNRSDLRQILHLEGLYKKNKAQDCPLKSMLEIIVRHHIEGHKEDRTGFNSDVIQTVSTTQNLVTKSPTVTPTVYDNTRAEENTTGLIFNKTDMSRSLAEVVCSSHGTLSSFEASNTPPTTTQRSIWSHSLSSEGQQDRQPVPSFLDNDSSAKRESFSDKNTVVTTESTNKNKTSRLRRGMMAGPVASSPQESNKKRQTRRLGGPNPLLANDENNKNIRDGSLLTTVQSQRMVTGLTELSTADPMRESQQPRSTLGKGFDEDGFGFERVGQDKHKTSKTKSMTNQNVDLHMSEMILDDIDDDEELRDLSRVSCHSSSLPQTTSDSQPMNQHTAIALKELILGSSTSCFSAEWRSQSFTFSDTPDLRYGLVQKKGGPCGVLASVQACILQKLLFEETGSDAGHQRLRPSGAVRTKCLTLATAEILWRAGEGKKATIAITSGRNHFTLTGHRRSEGVLEKITCIHVDNLKDLQLLVEQHIQQFESGALGCILLTISAILSRSIDRVREDMDVPTTTLIGAHGYCTQELVNLLLCGQAVSNVFNNNMELDSGNGNLTLLKGIRGRSDIGLLSLFEHYNICKVGSNLKTPKFPIWVVCSESHFSVLFGVQELLTDQCVLGEFDLYYYDGLANQQEEICLTVSVGTSGISAGCQDIHTDLIPPLEHCIRTKWKDAIVNWNDTEPIL